MTWSSLIVPRLGMLAVAGLCLTAGLQPAQATVLAPGGSCAGCTAFTSADLGVLQASISVAVQSPAPGGASVWSGVLRSAVYTDGVAGGATDGLVFIYQFLYNSGTEGIHRISDFNFTSFITDFGFIVGDPDGGGIFTAGNQAFATGDRSSVTGGTVGFNYDGNLIGTAETSYTMVVKTNATSWTTAIAGVANGGTANAASFAPIPEPGTYGLLALGMGGLIAIARRRKLNA